MCKFPFQGARGQEQGGPGEDQEEDQGAAQPQRQGEEGAQEGREAEAEKVEEEHCMLPKLLLYAAPSHHVVFCDSS